jgi:dTDP-4-dehydrorhamnose 3,5-epimerase
MEIVRTELEGLLLIKPRVFADHRGYFFESFNDAAFRSAAGVERTFVQDNESKSDRGVLRGLHFQMPPHAQAKLVRVVKGAVLDVCVDIRPNSPTYGRHFKAVLDGDNKHMLYIPEGFAHGFHTLEDNTIFAYKCTAYYDKASERSIQWNDTDLAVDWDAPAPVLSDKDRIATPFRENPWPKDHV